MLAPASRTGPLLVAAGAATFVGAFAEVGWPVAAQLAALLTWSMVAILGQALITHPDGRVRSARTWIPVVGLYLLVPLTPPDGPWLMGAGLLAALGARRVLDGRDPRRGAADTAGVIAAAGLMSGALLDLLAPGIPLDQLALQLGAVVSAAVLLAADTIRLAPLRARVTDAVLLLDPASGRRVVDELRRATGDPTLAVAYPVAGGRYVDDAGRPITLPDATSGRSMTTIARAGGRRRSSSTTAGWRPTLRWRPPRVGRSPCPPRTRVSRVSCAPSCASSRSPGGGCSTPRTMRGPPWSGDWQAARWQASRCWTASWRPSGPAQTQGTEPGRRGRPRPRARRAGGGDGDAHAPRRRPSPASAGDRRSRGGAARARGPERRAR